MPLNPREQERYGRNWVARTWDAERWELLRTREVVVAGLGSAGSSFVQLLAVQGAGHLWLHDTEPLTERDLGVSTLFRAEQLGRSRGQAGAVQLGGLAPALKVRATEEFPTGALYFGDLNTRAGHLLLRSGRRPAMFAWGSHGDGFGFASSPTGCPACAFNPNRSVGQLSADESVWRASAPVVSAVAGWLAHWAVEYLVQSSADMGGRLVTVDAGLVSRSFNLPGAEPCRHCQGLTDESHGSARGETGSGRGRGDRERKSRDRNTELGNRLEPQVAAELLKQGDVLVLDVRNPGEYSLGHLPGAMLVPVSELSTRMGELNPQADWLVYCKSGLRSERAVAMMRQSGFARVFELQGGIVAWRREVDSSLPEY